MTDWRAMNSLLVLRGQVNVIAPLRAKASDGLVADTNHSTSSGHYPHAVAGVGSAMVTAWDATNDPGAGCDSRRLAETLRRHRDPRIRYVISEREIFSSYPVGSRAAWVWGPYAGDDPHVQHAHIQTLDAPISDTKTPWNLEGFAMAEPMYTEEYTPGFFAQAIAQLDETVRIPAASSAKVVGGYAGFTGAVALSAAVKRIDAQTKANGAALTEIKSLLQQILTAVNAGAGGTFGLSTADHAAIVADVKEALREGTASA